MKRLTLLIALSSFLLGTLGACNTVGGIGKDIERAGEKVQEVSKKK